MKRKTLLRYIRNFIICKIVKVGNTVHETDFISLGNAVSKLSEVYSNSIYVGYIIFLKFEYVDCGSTIQTMSKVSKDAR